MALPQPQKQRAFLGAALRWIRDDPGRFVRLELYDAVFYLIPGVSWRHYTTKAWLASFLVSFPVYALGYFGLILYAARDRRAHFWMIGIFAAMFLFSTVWYVQNRFRTVTLEPFLIIYAAAAVHWLWRHGPFGRHAIDATSS